MDRSAEIPFMVLPCRICGSSQQVTVLDYGEVALAGALLESPSEFDSEPRAQLTLVVCEECRHLQLRETVDRERLFGRYGWRTGVGMQARRYCAEFARQVTRSSGLAPNSLVLEIASNDGTQLNEFGKLGHRVLGVEPAVNLCPVAEELGVESICSFFDAQVAASIRDSYGQVDLIVAKNVIAHVSQLSSFCEGMRIVLADDGMAVVEFPETRSLFAETQYDQVYHEHIGYHSLTSVVQLAERVGLSVVDVEEVDVHGGSLRCYLAHRSQSEPLSRRGEAILEQERLLLNIEVWLSFGERVRAQAAMLRLELEGAKKADEVVVGYGASGKGQSMIQFCRLTARHIDYIVDVAPHKQGKFTPGSHFPIHSPQVMSSKGVDTLVLFSWNIAEEILAQENSRRREGVGFLHPLPVPHYL